jgi:ankyrin repeat protein
MLISAGVPVDAKKKSDGATPLLMAAEDGFVPMVTALLARGASPNVKTTHDQMTPLLFAARDGNAEMAKLQIDAKADVNAKDRVGRNALKLG